MRASPLQIWGLTTPGMSDLFSAASIVEAMLAFEKNLALTLGETGLVPQTSAEAIALACDPADFDPESILATTWDSGTPVIQLVEEIRLRLEEEDARWVHYGSTTQDVVDSAHMLIASRALEELGRTLAEVARLLRELVVGFRDQPQMGRTFLQQAIPTTFGLRAAGWLETTLRHVTALRSTREELVIQLGGPVGSRSAYGEMASAVSIALADRLGLASSELAWHGDRSRILEVSRQLGSVAATVAKMAFDLSLLSQTEVGELSMRPGSSSSMEGKENPIDAIRALAATDVAAGAASILDRARPHELDRGLGSWQAEWVAMPLLFQTVAASLEALGSALETLQLDTDMMTKLAGPGASESIAGIDPRQIDTVLERYDAIFDEQ